MRKSIGRIVVPALLALLLGLTGPVGATSEPAMEGHGGGSISVGAPMTVEGAAGVGKGMVGAHAAPVEMQATDAHGGGHGNAHVSNSLSPAKLQDFFWRTVNFIALVILLVYFLAKPIAGGLESRRRAVQEELEGLETKRVEAERSYKTFESRLAGMEKEMEVIVEKAVAQAAAEKARILADAERTAEDVKRQAEAAIAAEVIEARRRLRDDVAEQAAAMAEELILANLTAEDQVNITEQYLAKVVQQ